MRFNAHRRIFFLLAFCALAILVLQTFWIRNFYVQVKSRFRGDVYSSLEHVAKKLEEMEQLKMIREKHGLSKVTSKNVRLKKKEELIDQVVMVSSPHKTFAPGAMHVTSFSYTEMPAAQTTREDFFVFSPGVGNVRHSVSTQRTGDSSGTTVTSSYSYDTGPDDDTAGEHKLMEMIERVMMEVRIVDNIEKNEDSLRSVIREALAAKGIFTPFEFSLRKLRNGRTKILAQSGGFIDGETCYKADLSSERVVRTNNFLYLQFPQESQVLLSGIKGSLALSLLFLGIVLGVFYYTIRILIRQKKISDIRDDFVNNMTHELKTPIATISLAVDAMKNPVVRHNDDKYNEYTGILKDENKKLNRHVERVLLLSLLEKGEVPLRKENVDIQVMILDIIGGFRLQAQSQSAKITFHCTRPVFANADPDHLSAAVSNLVDNALKYGGESVRINIRLDEEEGRAVIRVEDNGRGVSQGEAPRIFDKFYRVSQKDRHDIKGFGLGLSYVKTIAEMHGGTVTVHSQPGKGSRFTIQIPSHGPHPAG